MTNNLSKSLFRIAGVYILVIIIMTSAVGCLPDEEEEKKQDYKEKLQPEMDMPEEIEETEIAVLEIMELADTLHVKEDKENGIETELKEDNGEKDEEENEEDNGNEDEEEDNEEENEDNNEENDNEKEEEEEKPTDEESPEQEVEQITFDETIMLEVIEKELTALTDDKENSQANEKEEEKEEVEIELPDSEEQIWDEIKLNISELSEMWNDLESQVEEENISSEDIETFEDSLAELTNASTDENQIIVLESANKLTLPLAEFIKPYQENALPEIHKLKYYLRKILLTTNSDKYGRAEEALKNMRNLNETVEGELLEIEEKDEKEQKDEDEDEKEEALVEESEENDIYDKYFLSFEDLETVVLAEEDHELIKLKAITVMENIVEMIEEM